MKTRRSRRRRSASGRFVKRNPVRRRRKSARRRKAAIFSRRNPMKTRRRRSRRRSRGFARRNPVVRRSRRRRSSRRRSYSLRNPVGNVLSPVFNVDVFALAGGAVIQGIGSNMILNQLRVNPATAAWPGLQTRMGLMIWKTGIGALAAYLLRNQSPRLAQGIAIGTAYTLTQDLLAQSNVLSMVPGGSALAAAAGMPATAGVGRYLPAGRRGTGAYTPGVPSIFTGPASGFINRGAPQPNGVGAIVNRGFIRQAATAAPNPFAN